MSADRWFNAVITVVVPFDTAEEASAFVDGARIDRVMDAVDHPSAVASGTVEPATDEVAL